MSTSSVSLLGGKRSERVPLHSICYKQEKTQYCKWQIPHSLCVNSTNQKTVISLYFKKTTGASAALSVEPCILLLYTHHVVIAFCVEGLGKDCYNKNIDKKGDEESDRRLDEEVLVGLFYFLLIFAIDFPRLVQDRTNNITELPTNTQNEWYISVKCPERMLLCQSLGLNLTTNVSNLDQRWVQIDVMRHDDSAYDSHGLLQLHRPTASTVWYKHPLQQLPLVWLYQHVLQNVKRQNRSGCHQHLCENCKVRLY